MESAALGRLVPFVALLFAWTIVGCHDPEELPPTPLESTDDDDTGVTDEQAEECPPCELDADPCDEAGDDLFLAMGLGCDDRPVIESSHWGDATAVAISTGVGTWKPTEGDYFIIMGTGRAADLSNPAIDCATTAALGTEFDLGSELPAPIQTHNVGEVDCLADPGLVGAGDCSNTIEGQFTQGGSAFDYSEIRTSLTVPDDANSVKFDLAFLTSEYPDYVGSAYNDMFIGWLESESWTGNISFDTAGHPISVNAGFLDYKDDDANLPAFTDTCMRGHGATNWLTSTAGVTSGEEIELVFAIFDLGDSIYDSFVLLDNFRWGCDGCAGPTTVPEDDETDTGGN